MPGGIGNNSWRALAFISGSAVICLKPVRRLVPFSDFSLIQNFRERQYRMADTWEPGKRQRLFLQKRYSDLRGRRSGYRFYADISLTAGRRRHSRLGAHSARTRRLLPDGCHGVCSLSSVAFILSSSSFYIFPTPFEFHVLCHLRIMFVTASSAQP